MGPNLRDWELLAEAAGWDRLYVDASRSDEALMELDFEKATKDGGRHPEEIV